MRGRWSVDPYFVAGLIAVLAAGALFLFKNTSAAGVRIPPSEIEPIIAALDSLGLAHQYGPSGDRIQVVELFDFECPACAAAHLATWPSIQEFVAAGLISFTAYDMPLPTHRYAVPAALVMSCVEEVDSVRAWDVRHAVFKSQSDWVQAYPVEAALLAIAADLQVDTVDARRCIRETGGQRTQDLKGALDVARRHGLTGIPLWIVNGQVVRWSKLEESILEIGER